MYSPFNYLFICYNNNLTITKKSRVELAQTNLDFFHYHRTDFYSISNHTRPRVRLRLGGYNVLPIIVV
jgi:hypothetical protein